jgi:hypothetical protein
MCALVSQTVPSEQKLLLYKGNLSDVQGVELDIISLLHCKLGNEPSGSIKCWELPNGCTTCGLSSGTQLHRVS